MILPPEQRGHPLALTDAQARRGGFTRITINPAAALSVIFTPVRHAGGCTESDRRAFRKRVAKRRRKKGYA